MVKIVAALLMALSLSGCSTSGVVSSLIGSKPDVTAQAGAENVKQTVGVTAKQDTSSKQESTIKDSAVGKVDSSNKKHVSASTIQAETIKAEQIHVVQGGDNFELIFVTFALACFFIAGFIAGVLWSNRKNKGA